MSGVRVTRRSARRGSPCPGASVGWLSCLCLRRRLGPVRQSPGPKQGRAAAGAQQARGHSAGAGLALVVQNSVFRGNAVVRKLVIYSFTEKPSIYQHRPEVITVCCSVVFVDRPFPSASECMQGSSEASLLPSSWLKAQRPDSAVSFLVGNVKHKSILCNIEYLLYISLCIAF